VRSANCLKLKIFITLVDLIQRTEAELLRTPNLGRKSLNEIKEVWHHGTYIRNEISNWPPANLIYC